VYREVGVGAAVRDVLACGWVQRVGSSGFVQRVVPDGCVDVVRFGDGSVRVAGPATRAVGVALAPGSVTVGVRFRVGAAGGVLGVPLSALRDEDVELSELWDRPVVERLRSELSAAADPVAGVAVLESAMLARRRTGLAEPDPLVAAAVRGIRAREGSAGVRSLAARLGVSERQLLRRFQSAIGYGPATLARVLRLQRFLTAGWSEAGGTVGLGRLAADAGYADQAHLARECRELAGASPSVMLGRRAA